MFDLIKDAFLSLQSDTATYPQHIQIWMRVMALSFLGSLVFVYSKVGARWILAVFLLNVFGLILGRIVFPELSRTALGTSVHLLFWPSLLWMAWRPMSRPQFKGTATGLGEIAYGLWLCWVSLLIAISLCLDILTLVSWL